MTGSTERALQPSFEDGGLLAQADSVGQAFPALDGVWTLVQGEALLGETPVLRQTPGYASLYGERDATYAVLQAGCLEDQGLVLEGYYRKAVDTDLGLMRLFVEPPAAASALCVQGAYAGALTLRGSYGQGSDEPSSPLELEWKRSLPASPTSAVVAHRGGCRSSDDCGASENSVEMLRMAQRLGAERIEIDVQVTSDGVPIVYHDAEFGPLLTQGPYCRGPVADFTWPHVTQLCSLLYGEHVPRLDEAIRVVAEETNLAGVWLDVKTPEGLRTALPIVRRWNSTLAERQRELRLVLGLSTVELVDAWLELGDTSDLDCLVELEVSDLERTGCHVWAPRWTRGPMAATVSALQAAGNAVAFWTLDEQEFIDRFIEEAQPRAILTNRPGLVFHRSVMDAIAREEAGAP